MPLSPTATRDLLAQLGHTPKRFLGQNFLIDGNIIRKSLELAEVQAGDTVVEIGPGLGTLTTSLLEAGADVWAVEMDRSLHAHLETTLALRYPTQFHLLEGDAVEYPLAGFGPNREPGRSHAGPLEKPPGESTPPTAPANAPAQFKIVANLPYAIATPWLDAVLGGPLPTRLVLMLQQEAAQRYAAQPGSKSFGAISVFLQAAYAVAPGHKVSAGCFFPRPDVESHLLHLVRRPSPVVFTPAFKALVRSCFQQRRKQMGALLRSHWPAPGPDWRGAFVAAGLTEQARPEAVPLAVWESLARVYPP